MDTLCPGVAASIYRATQPQYSVSSRNHSLGELQCFDVVSLTCHSADVSRFVCLFVFICLFVFCNHCLLFFRCDSPEKLKSILPRLEQELKDSTKFKDFYQFTFNFAKNPTQKGLGKSSSVSLRSGGDS